MLSSLTYVPCSIKVSHERNGQRVAHFFYAFTYGKNMIIGEQYFGHIFGEPFADFVRENFKEMFLKGSNPKSKASLQDGDTSKNNEKSKNAVEVGARQCSIPTCNPNLNLIEDVCKNVKSELPMILQKMT